MRFALVALVACSSALAPGYLDEAASRRATLVAELVNPANNYSTLRLAHYATGDGSDWDALPIWNPPSEPFTLANVSAPLAPLDATATPLAIDDDSLTLGEDAFFRYPVQTLTDDEVALLAAGEASTYGFWSDETRGIGGLVRVTREDGSVAIASTCSTCHALVQNGALVVGMTNANLDYGKFILDASHGLDPRTTLATWGQGRIDVTTEAGTEPVRIPDLRPVVHLGFLHATASVAQNDLASLSVRLETLLITDSGETTRPPREITLALANYVWSLASELDTRPPSTDAEIQGQAIFETNCATCHAPPNYTGPPVPLDVVGTDPTVGLSLDRGTGNYRVASLLGVSARPLLVHDASVSSLDQMFDPSRTSTTYVGRLGGPIEGHTFGLDLDDDDRAALVAFLRTL